VDFWVILLDVRDDGCSRKKFSPGNCARTFIENGLKKDMAQYFVSDRWQVHRLIDSE
jgi:hypothetical protein